MIEENGRGGVGCSAGDVQGESRLDFLYVKNEDG